MRQRKLAVVEGNELFVVLQLREDRWEHGIGVRFEDRFVPLLTSIEGAIDETWPPSPALQELSVADGETVEVAHLVGMAGRSHWSMSVGYDSLDASIRFDTAVRIHELPSQLLSSYAPVEQWRIYGSRLEVWDGRSEFGVALSLEYDQEIEVQRKWSVSQSYDKFQLPLGGDQICIKAQVPPKAPPQTIRWAYRVSRLCEIEF